VKVGDLVQLSEYGRKLKNFYVGRENDVALVLSGRWGCAYVIQWCSDGKKSVNVDRKDIKYAKKEPTNG
jgi:hypothetical protein